MDNNIEEKLNALFLAYTNALPNKLNLLNQQWQALSSHWNKEAFAEFYRAVHSLAGSSGTYGYKELSKITRELELFLKGLYDQEYLTEENKKEIQSLLSKIISSDLTLEKEKPIPHIAPHSHLLPINKLVYVLDNESDFASEIRSNLESLNYTVIIFSHFDLLKKSLEEKIPCALIIDIERLDISDIDYLHKYQFHEVPPILFCTAKQGDLATRLNAFRTGASGFFKKPIEAFYLTKTIDQTCSPSAIEPLKVLIVDDSLSLAEYYATVLEEAGMEVRTETHPLQVLDVLTEFRADLLLLDVYMPECSGLELAAVLRQETLYAGIPIVFLSTEDDRLKQLTALSVGGDDFLTKPILPKHLVSAVRSRAKRAGILGSYMARDSLTGLFNHTNILQHLEIELARAKRLNTPLGFIMLDIDHFKSINDTYGHPMGDKVLRKLSELLLTRLRSTDISGRYGGEEFAVILPNIPKKEIMKLCSQLREKFSRFIFKSEDQEFQVTFSAGIVMYPDVCSVVDMIEIADQALYQAKNQGRNREVLAFG